MKSFRILITLCLLLFVASCTRIETGEVGLRKDFNGNVESSPVGTGFHQTIVGDVLVFSGKEAIFPLKNLHPQTHDKLTMEDVDISFGYFVNPQFIAELYTRYAASAHQVNHGVVFPMATFVESLMTSATNDVIAKYDALEVNNNRTAISKDILDTARIKLKTEGLDGKVTVTQVILTQTMIPKSVTESATAVVTAQNALKAKEFELQTTKVEAQRIQALAAQSDDRYVRYLNAQAMLEIAKKAPAYIIVPNDFGKSGFAYIPPIK